MFEKIKRSFYFILNKKRIIEKSKKCLIFWYLIFDGDEHKILQAMYDEYGLDNIEYFNKTLEGVNLNQYITIFDKEYRKFNLSKKLIYKIE